MTTIGRPAALLKDQLRIAFRREFPIPADTDRFLVEAVEATLQSTGNFVRAQLAYRMGIAYGMQQDAAEKLAISLEYFHTASLLFDDLPSMDDATQRRGVPCLHLLYGEGPAILTALGLINRAYGLLWGVGARGTPCEEQNALAYVEKYLGLGGLLSGQSHDLHYAQLPEEERSPQKAAMGKTVSLIRLSLVLPAIVGGANGRVLRLLDVLAVLWGLAYQGMDALRDVLHETDRAGKTPARYRALARPNRALTRGVGATMDRVRKLVATGEHVVDRLVRLDASLLCLDVPRQRLSSEVAGIGLELYGVAQ